ncbi:MAG: transcriptional regulator, AraC family [Chryseobacterium sp.]|jgi:AraC-like DNA-binding protein|uniref:helix-turn-helix domain-containing protein n=1 Tax=Chryseobacterium sp. TaxID=1871047 RepID=UPI00260201E8|nr:helix-turn-helix domain-containing protein [Chryseobacterium sp.]MDF2552163.1 transcriptional regulator, AraC family [Chryseobacterium sp.]
MKHYNDISIFSKDVGVDIPEHPLFGITFGHDDNENIEDIVFTADFYIISFTKFISGNITYGKQEFDHQRGRLIFFKPNHTVTFKNVKLEDDCFLITIKEDFLSGTALFKEIKNYSYFDYETNEALYLSPSEEETIWNLVRTMHKETCNNTDDYSKPILLSHLGTLLTYSQRFYKRQFINRIETTGAYASRFQQLLDAYYSEKKVHESGLPTVSYMADKFNVSSRYLSDLLKQETGKTALELIHIHLIKEAKNLLTEGRMNISEISYSLGFENPNYFARLFKKEVGIPPNVFRDNHLN